MKYCTKCKTVLGMNDADNFCWTCGAKLININLSCECGHMLHPSDSFCPNCGKKINKEDRIEQ